jgi:hypothetical protein
MSDEENDEPQIRSRPRPYELVEDRRVVETAAETARELVFSRFDTPAVEDLDVTVTFEDGILEIDVYLDVPEPGLADPEQVADDAALAARRAVDELIADAANDDA